MTRPTDSQENQISRLSRIDLSTLPPDGGERYNRLIFEKSPYLLQHAENPINWYSWGEDAWNRARREDKPVFLSIGYSTCHWCHVMAHESFEDDEVARVLNRHFIAVKVDREERPDLDNAFMAVCHLMTGSGGWPTTLILSPDQKPFFAATYLPRRSRGGMAGLIEILEKISQLWQSDRARLLQTGAAVAEAITRSQLPSEQEEALSDAPLLQALSDYLNTFDRRHGGFGTAPKFPAPHNLSLLFRLFLRTGDKRAKAMALQTLQRIRLGGIFDQLGFGLHRYSVDQRWLVPHFEKMLYDQALAIQACTDAYQLTGDLFYRQSILEIADYIARQLTDKEGGFYCGEDADSEGEEGTFYLWTPEQIRALLGDEASVIFCRAFGITSEGHLDGKSIPHLDEDLDALATRAGVSADALSKLLTESRQRLFQAREKRPRPHRDDKVLTGWNGLAIAALARAGAVLDEAALVTAAEGAANFILERMRTKEGRLLRRYRVGDAAIPAFLEDYTFFVWGLIELYQAVFDPRLLKEALALTSDAETLFGDGKGGFYDTGNDAEAVLGRGRMLQDGALPSGTSVAACNLLRLGRLTGRHDLEEAGERVVRYGLSAVSGYPSAFSQFLIALDFALGPKSEVVIAGDEQKGKDLLQTLRRRFLPRTVLLLRRPDDLELDQLSHIVRGKTALDGDAAAYLCLGQTCRPPVRRPEDLAALLPA